MLKGQGLLSLWNGFEESRREEYDLWHTRQHVPERLGVSGMLRARRYDRGLGPLPEFLTLYELESNAVLSSDPYRSLLENPTAWSQRMRPAFRAFFRVAHQVAMSRGAGMGGAILTATFDEPGEWTQERLAKTADEILWRTAATAVHFLTQDPHVPPVPFATPDAGSTFAEAAAIMVEGYGRDSLNASAGRLDAILDDHGIAPERAGWTSYELAYVLDADDAGNVVVIDRPPG
jgi:hypothetical protein